MTILEASNLRKIYRAGTESIHALRGVDLRIEAGEFIIINGPSGSGKTTLLNLLGGIDQPSEGTISLFGLASQAAGDRARTLLRRRRIGLIFQAFELIPVLTARENVEYPLLLQRVKRSERRRRVASILAKVGLESQADRYPSQLSGGQKQRVAIARALVTEPLLVLADEPTGSLDSETGRRIVELMRELNARLRVAFVVVTHDLELNRYADRVYRIKDGLLTRLEAAQDAEDCLA